MVLHDCDETVKVHRVHSFAHNLVHLLKWLARETANPLLQRYHWKFTREVPFLIIEVENRFFQDERVMFPLPWQRKGTQILGANGTGESRSSYCRMVVGWRNPTNQGKAGGGPARVWGLISWSKMWQALIKGSLINHHHPTKKTLLRPCFHGGKCGLERIALDFHGCEVIPFAPGLVSMAIPYYAQLPAGGRWRW